jgi:exopolysaccharide biosynthesis protein
MGLVQMDMNAQIGDMNTNIGIRRQKREQKRKARIKKISNGILSMLIVIIGFGAGMFGLLRVGALPNIQEFIVTSAMTTMSHKYLAYIAASGDQIKKILENNKIDENYEKFDGSKVKDQYSTDRVELYNIDKDGYKGYMLIVTNPKRVFLGSSSKLGQYGDKIAQISANYNALGGINAGGFSDANGQGKGGTPTGLVIENGYIKYMDKSLSKFNIIGFNRDNILVIGQFRKDEINNLNLRDAIDFHPFLVLNGKPVKMYGNGGWGTGPRTAIGQKADGTVIMVVIDGRQLSSVGASMKQLQEIMIENGAVNAANLDGGASSVLYFKDKIINNPSSPHGDRYLPSAFLINKEGLSENNIINKTE